MENKMVKILACDLSMTGTAFALLTFSEGLLTEVKTCQVDNSKNASKGYGHRLWLIRKELLAFTNWVLLDHVVIEKGFTKFNTATQTLFRVLGVVELTLHECMRPEPVFLPPVKVKKIVTGSGKATKEEVAEAIEKYLPQPMYFKTLDETDAVAVGIAFAIENKLLNPVTNGLGSSEPSVKDKTKTNLKGVNENVKRKGTKHF